MDSAVLGIVANVVELLAGAGTIVGFGIYSMRQFQRNTISPIINDIAIIKENMSPNGGSTLRDSVDRIEVSIGKLYARNQLLSEVLEMGVFETDKEGYCISVSKEWCSLTGLTEEESLGNGWVNGIHMDDRELVFSEWKLAVEQKRSFLLEYRMMKAKVKGHAIPIFNKEGEICRWIGSVTVSKN